MEIARRGVLVALAVVALGVAARAQTAPGASAPGASALVQHVETSEREFDAGYGQAVRVTTGPHGGVQVSAWREHKVRVEARIELNAPTAADLTTLAKVVGFFIDPSRSSIEVTTRGPHDKKWMKSVKDFPKRLQNMPWRIDYVIWVPEYTSLLLEVADGETLVDGVNGVIEIVNAHGDIRLTNVSGATRALTADGRLTISTKERSWRGGNLRGTASRGVSLMAPRGFSAYVDAEAPGGVILVEADRRRVLGTYFTENLGNGGATVTLASAGTVEITLAAQP